MQTRTIILIVSFVLTASLTATDTSPAFACPGGKYQNTLSRLCDPCPAECLTNPPPAGTSDNMLGICRDLASQCAPGGPTAASTSASVVVTETSSADDLSSPDQQQQQRHPISPGGLVAIIISVIVFAALSAGLVAAFIIHSRARGQQMALTSSPADLRAPDNKEEETKPLNSGHSIDSANGHGDARSTAQEASDYSPSDQKDASSKVSSRPGVPEFEQKSPVVPGSVDA